VAGRDRTCGANPAAGPAMQAAAATAAAGTSDDFILAFFFGSLHARK